MKWWFVFIGCMLLAGGKAQVYYVVPGGNGDGTSWEKAGGNIGEALKSSGVKEVRVKWGVYTLEKELDIPVGVILSGGWGADGRRQAGGTEATVLQAAGKTRVATVSGTLDGFTVCGGIAAGKDGGGLYVKGTGTVLNCIVKDNYAGDYYPRVGDVQLADGTFLRREEITPSDRDRIRGIVFWVNPEPGAPVGKRGWLAAKEGMRWSDKWCNGDIAEVNITAKLCHSVKEALEDTAGWQHCHEIQKANQLGNCPMINACFEYSPNVPAEVGKWYLPALGQLRFLLNEYREINLTWWKIYPEYVSSKYMNQAAISSSEAMDLSTGKTTRVWSCDFSNPYMIGAVNKIILGAMYDYVPVTSF